MIKEVLPDNADYLLPKFDKAGEPVPEPMNYTGSAALTRRLFADLKVPIFDSDKGEWDEGEEKLLPTSLTTFWTEHAPRSVIPTAAQSLGASKEARDGLGRWSPTGSDEYARAYRAAAGGLQHLVRKAVLNRDKRLVEDEVYDRILQSPEYGNTTAQQAEAMCDSIQNAVNSFDGELKKAGGYPEEEEEILVHGPIISGPTEAVKIPKMATEAGCLGKFLIVYTRNRKSAKLHKIGGCEWTQVTINDSLVTGHINSQMYNTRCKLCFPKSLEAKDSSDPFVSDSELSEV